MTDKEEKEEKKTSNLTIILIVVFAVLFIIVIIVVIIYGQPSTPSYKMHHPPPYGYGKPSKSRAVGNLVTNAIDLFS